jgi:hypothetical protein
MMTTHPIAADRHARFNARLSTEEPSSMSRFPIYYRLGTAALGMLLLASAAFAQATDHSVGASHIKPSVNTTAPLNWYETALKYKQQGEFPKAIELLEPEAKQGKGFEMAMLVLGQCYLGMADKAPTPQDAVDDTKKGGAWFEGAAESGLTEAQEQMSRLYIEGGRFKVEPVEAGKWYMLWKANPKRFQAIGKPFDPKLEQKLKDTLTDAQWTEARQAAMDLARRAPAQ